MKILKNIATAFSMFSVIPMPHFEWDRESMQYMLCAFPLVGGVIGAVMYGWMWLGQKMSINPILFAAVFTVVPIALTGGIHLDGYCDTSDALASHGDREKMLAIMTDTHTGAFAIISFGCYLLLYFASAAALILTPHRMVAIGLSFMLTRALSGIAIAGFPCAKTSGLVHTFSNFAAKKKTLQILCIELIVIIGVLLWSGRWDGVLIAGCSGVVFLFYRLFSEKIFGGITGDLAGCFVQVCELIIIAMLALI